MDRKLKNEYKTFTWTQSIHKLNRAFYNKHTYNQYTVTLPNSILDQRKVVLEVTSSDLGQY